MKNLLSAISILLIASASSAGTPLDQVNAIDTAREGQLSKLVLADYEKNYKAACDVLQLAKTEIMKISTNSINDEKTVDTPYSYEANYLVVQKCLYGSTFQGAYSDVRKAVILKGSFNSSYNKKGGPALMKNLKIELIKNVNL